MKIILIAFALSCVLVSCSSTKKTIFVGNGFKYQKTEDACETLDMLVDNVDWHYKIYNRFRDSTMNNLLLDKSNCNTWNREELAKELTKRRKTNESGVVLGDINSWSCFNRVFEDNPAVKEACPKTFEEADQRLKKLNADWKTFADARCNDFEKCLQNKSSDFTIFALACNANLRSLFETFFNRNSSHSYSCPNKKQDVSEGFFLIESCMNKEDWDYGNICENYYNVLYTKE
ncbi:hypothetical protein KJ966_20840 [bacterium]|nr:hypothetical protein [bacterium]